LVHIENRSHFLRLCLFSSLLEKHFLSHMHKSQIGTERTERISGQRWTKLNL
jgi:hypothetical protein